MHKYEKSIIYDLIAAIISCAMYVLSMVPTSWSRRVQSLIPSSMTPLPHSCTRKLMYFVPKTVAESPVRARPNPVFMRRNAVCSSINRSYSRFRIGPINFCRVGPLYLANKTTTVTQINIKKNKQIIMGKTMLANKQIKAMSFTLFCFFVSQRLLRETAAGLPCWVLCRARKNTTPKHRRPVRQANSHLKTVVLAVFSIF